MKKNDYLCPKCKGHLNVGDHVVLTTKNNRKKKGVILLSPDVGSYSYIHHSAYGFQDGELVEFHCPICQKDLQSSSNPDFVSIIMVDHNNMEYKVMFSRKVGEKSTYVVSNDDVVEMFGEDAVGLEDAFDEYDYL